MTKTRFLSLLLLCQISAAFADIDLGQKVGSTPYDRHMSIVREVLKAADSKASMNDICKFMFMGRKYSYLESKDYKPAPPETTERRKGGDCKDKALWLAKKLNDPSVRFVIGMARSDSAIGHSWLYWKDSESRWWILDCTNRRHPVLAESLSTDQYIPCYSYTRDGAFRHGGASKVAKFRFIEAFQQALESRKSERSVRKHAR